MKNAPIVRCFVWGWDDQVMAAYGEDLRAIIQYAENAMICGLSGDEVSEDLLERFDHLFEDVDFEIQGGEFHVVCLPHGLSPIVPAIT